MKLPTLLVLLLLLSCKTRDDAEIIPLNKSQAYTVTFAFGWDPLVFPTDYPSNPHFSPIVGWVHKKENYLFTPGTIASDGIEQMAEDGITSTLVNELKTRISKDEGLQTYVESGNSGGTGNISFDIEVTTEFPSVTLATMLAPSPDWYIACVNVMLLEEEGEFVTEKTLNPHVYDAGSDSGDSYTSSNIDTNPKEPIAVITTPPLAKNSVVSPTICNVTFRMK